ARLSSGARGPDPRSPRRGATGLTTSATATVSPMDVAVTAPRELDGESREWLRALRATGTGHDQAVERLHALLLRATRFEVARRRPMLPHLRGNDLDEIALQAADDALMSVLAKLDDFRGASRFTTWVYKFGLLEAAVKLRRRAGQGREIPPEPGTGGLFGNGATRA